jgi:hypothetical protein
MPAKAQSIDAFKERLAVSVPSQTTFGGETKVTVTEYGDAATAVKEWSKTTSRLRVRGYRVCIFFDNGPENRAGAAAARDLF